MEQTKKKHRVYFDDLKVNHYKFNNVVQSDDYYPFGLSFNSYQRTAATPNDFLYNGKERQDAQSQFGVDLGVGWTMGRLGGVEPSDSWNYTSFKESKMKVRKLI